MSRSGPELLAVVGPTASGKTRVAVGAALELDGEVISMDSRQVYRGMDVGTAKVTPGEAEGVPHHGLDLVDPDETYSAGRFARDARRWIREIRGRGRVPVAAGGTGFFLRALTDPIFREPPVERGRRDALREWLEARPAEELERWVRRLDPARAEVAAEGGTRRLSRTLEVALLTGRPLSWWHEHAPPDGRPLEAMVFLLELPRGEMDRRIDRRVGAMVEDGFVDEVRGLLAAGYRPDDPGLSGTGYREVARHLAGEITLDEAVERTRRATRRYARRQLTWFRNQLPPGTVRVDATRNPEEQVARIVESWRRATGAGASADREADNREGVEE